MTRVARENALCALSACAGSALLAWLGLYGFAWNDYDTEARPALEALLAGHLAAFARSAPAYGGSLLERAPFAALAQLWGGGQLAVYRMAALPCLLAAAALAVWLAARMRAQGEGTFARAVAVAVCVASPVTLLALEAGHPEDLLGGVLCVAAVLLAARGRALWAGLALGLAIANKEWALIAAGPVLLALAPALRVRCAAACTACAASLLAPIALLSTGGFVAGTRAVASSSSVIFQPWQAWWFLGAHGALVHGLFGQPKPGYRVAPAWTGQVSHPLIVLVAAGLSLVLWARVRRRPLSRAGEREALLALALVLLARCMLDTWDTAYYAGPLILALLAYEACAVAAGPPLLALAVSVLVWVNFQWLPLHASADAQAALYLAWSLALAAWLAARLLAPTGARRSVGAQPTTVSSVGRLVSSS